MSLKLRPLGVPASEPLPPSPFERGRLIGWDDFESASVKYHPTISGAGTIGRSTTNPMFGDFSLKMVTGAVANDYCKIHYPVNEYRNGRIGAQIGFASQSTSCEITGQMYYYTGTTVYTGELKYDLSNNELSYLGDDGVYYLIDTIDIWTGGAGWIIPYTTMELVIDLESNKYARAIFSSNEYDLSSYNLYSSAFAVDRGLMTYWQLKTTAAAAQTAYFDRYRLREDEPA